MDGRIRSARAVLAVFFCRSDARCSQQQVPTIVNVTGQVLPGRTGRPTDRANWIVMEPTPADQSASTRFADRYLLGERIGYGGAAEVYRAWDEKLERAVAIKLFRVDQPGLAEAQRHRAEMRI